MKETRVPRRILADVRKRFAKMIDEGCTRGDIMATLRIKKATFYSWQKAYLAGGLDALAVRPAPGGPTKLGPEREGKLYQWVVGRDPRQFQFDFGLWTRKIIRELILREFGVTMTPQGVGQLLARLGLSPQRPTYRPHQQDPEKVRVWKEETYPRIRAQAAAAGASIFFEDEAAVRTDHHAGTTWGRVGRTPVVRATGERKSVNMISAVSPRGELHFDVFQGNMNAAGFIEFCKKLLHDCPTPVFLIVDGSSTHTAKVVQEYVKSTNGRLSLFFLPPYSPELNPDEWVWRNVKSERIARAVPMSQGHLWSLAQDALKRLQQLPEIVRGFFGDPRLAYISQGV